MDKRKAAGIVLLLIFFISIAVVLIISRDSTSLEAVNPKLHSEEINNTPDIPEDTLLTPTPYVTESAVPDKSPALSPDKIVNDQFVFPKKGTRPYIVMIDNEGSKSLPQGGLQFAQLIYEIIVEGGETRLMPVFWDVKPEMIGPVRSSRHYFLDYALEHDSIYIHIGWSPMAKRDLSVFNINNVNGVTDGWSVFYELTDEPDNWQDSYTTIERILKFAKKKNYKTDTDVTPLFQYNTSNKEPERGFKAKKIKIRYSGSYTCSFKYDPVTKTYLRFRKGDRHIERITGKQIAAKNIILQKVRNYGIKNDNAGRQEVVTTGSGTAVYITCGRAVEIKWSKKSRKSRTIYTYSNNEPVVLNPGQTWIQLVPEYGNYVID